MAVIKYFNANNGLPTQNTTHICSSYYASYYSNTNRINQE